MDCPKRNLNVIVLMGGVGDERDVSIESGLNVLEGLRLAGYDAEAADIRPDYLCALDNPAVDVFFVAMHGQFGEDGTIQRILQDRRLVYTGSGPAASRLAFDKIAAKQALAAAGVNTPAWEVADQNTDFRRLYGRLAEIGDKYVVKPARQGSSVGVSIADSPEQAIERLRPAVARFGRCLAERFIPGREVTAGILHGKVLPLIEVRTAGAFYDYDAKYVDRRTEYLFETIAPPAAAGVERTALECFNILRMRHFARVDFILDRGGVAYVLEVNSIPGMTGHSLLPKAAARAGIDMRRLVAAIVDAAVRDGSTEGAILP